MNRSKEATPEEFEFTLENRKSMPFNILKPRNYLLSKMSKSPTKPSLMHAYAGLNLKSSSNLSFLPKVENSRIRNKITVNPEFSLDGAPVHKQLDYSQNEFRKLNFSVDEDRYGFEKFRS